MARDLILAIDAGTSGIKVLSFDLDGNEVATAARPNSYRTGPGGAVDQDMARTWRDTVAVLRDVVADPAFATESAETRRRIRDTLALMDSLGTWGDEMLRLEPAVLMKIMKLGAKIQKLLRAEAK